MSKSLVHRTQVIGLVRITTFIGSPAAAHPGAEIVVDRQGQIYIVDTGVNTNLGVWKIDLDRTGQRLQWLPAHAGTAQLGRLRDMAS